MEFSLLALGLTSALLLGIRGPLIRAVLLPSPGGAVLITSILYIVGATVILIRDQTESAVAVYGTSFTFFFVYLTSYFSVSHLLGLRSTPIISSFNLSKRATGTIKWLFFSCMLALAVIAVLLAGYDRILVGLYQFVVLGNVDVSIIDLRVSIASGEEGWVGPGYLKQIRDVLLPLAALFLLFTIRRSKSSFILLALGLIVAVAVVLISTGQRGPLVLFFLGIAYASRNLVSWNLQSRRTTLYLVVFVAIVTFGMFAALTSTFTNRLMYADANFLEIFLDRVVTRVPEENLLTMEAWGRGASFPGAGWLGGLSTVLPGTQLGFSNFLHEFLGGRSGGHSSLGAWIDVYYNFGWHLGVGVTISLGFLVAFFNHWVNHLRSACPAAELCGLWISLCMLHVFAPLGFLLYGPATTFMVLLLIVLWIRTGRPLLRLVIGNAGPPTPDRNALFPERLA